jgi:hypothetical protein
MDKFDKHTTPQYGKSSTPIKIRHGLKLEKRLWIEVPEQMRAQKGRI